MEFTGLEQDAEAEAKYPGSFKLVMSPEEMDVLAAACRERTARRLRNHNEPLEEDLLIINYWQSREKGEGRVESAIPSSMESVYKISFPLQEFVDATAEEVARILDQTVAFVETDALRRHQLGKAAAEMLAQLEICSDVLEFSKTIPMSPDES